MISSTVLLNGARMCTGLTRMAKLKFEESRSIWEPFWLATLNSTYSTSSGRAMDQIFSCPMVPKPEAPPP